MKALALFSGGLDSVLAMKLIIDQGIEVIAIHVNTGFGATKDRKEHMINMCNQIEAKLEILDLREKFLDEVLFTPKYGYGKAFNPCIDCHGFMFRYSNKLLEKYNASFMISGEVVGQRPMSQRSDAMKQVANLSEDEDDLILRPLCAKLLPITKPEREGWVDREKLLDISGRSRYRQIELAKQFGLKDFEPPAGGCLLTEQNFGKKIEDFIKYKKLEVDDIDTLKFGRQLRLPDGAKLIIGRDKEDNQNLLNIKNNNYYTAKILNASGPVSLLQKNATQNDLKLATKLIITYGRCEANKNYEVDFGEFKLNDVKFNSKNEAKKYFIK